MRAIEEAIRAPGRTSRGGLRRIHTDFFRASRSVQNRELPCRRMNQDNPVAWSKLLRRPSAIAPIAMSVSALVLVCLYVLRFGAAREPDEGATAHLWQLLMAGQVPIIAFFLAKWLRRSPRAALSVLGFQLLAAAAAAAPVVFLGF